MTGVSSPQRNLRFADFTGGLDLTQASFAYSWLDNSRFNGANLTNASLESAILTNADLSGTNLTNARLGASTAPLDALFGGDPHERQPCWGSGSRGGLQAIRRKRNHSSATLFHGELPAEEFAGIGLSGNNLTGGDFSGQDLTGADLDESTLTNANLSGTNSHGCGAALFCDSQRTPTLLGRISLVPTFCWASTADHRANFTGAVDCRGGVQPPL